MGDLLKNVRVAGGVGAVVCSVIALGIYQPDDTGAAALTTFVGLCAGGAFAAVLAKFAAGKKGPEAPKP